MLIISENAYAATEIQKLNYDTEQYHPRQVCEQLMRSVHVRLRHCQFCLLWIDLPKSGKAVPPKKWTSTMRELALWVRAAKDTEIPAIISGWRGKHWQWESIQALLQDGTMNESRHALCGYGVPHIDYDKRAAIHTYTTKPIAQRNCNCKSKVQERKIRMTEAM